MNEDKNRRNKDEINNKKSGMVPEVPDSKLDIVTKFQDSIFKNYEVRGGGRNFPPPNVKKIWIVLSSSVDNHPKFTEIDINR